ncbi:MAG: hypothetical protein EBS29_01215 [Chloroflexia bacterium]|nr:hypothetical protein [Chloroflexia bacterium]
MCGATRFSWHDTADLLLTGATPTALTTGQYESRYWAGMPVLPVRDATGALALWRWGNRNEVSGIPATGWAQKESIDAGKWHHHHPQFVQIPVTAGYEQGVWFGIDHGIHGIIVAERVFMLTVAADTTYQNMTHHPRMPWLINQTIIVPLAGSRQQLGLW